ncbi:2Fe-2S iron-sulfur cluster-binding protein [Pseudonocardia nantongensis]|uniref:2Fe-2S iron-sulfur cluster-binding protein n=1 Tax=Pseudonocardia nantongensis TaxID=1181885 RepID=UPI00397BD2E3
MVGHHVSLNGGPSFDAREGQTILDAALRANRWIPHNCSQGTCGTCRFKVLEGTVDHGDSTEELLPQADRTDGFALACQASPVTDLLGALLGESAITTPRHRLRDITGTVVVRDVVARETIRLVIDLDEPLDFDAGQYVELRIPNSPLRRAYSIASPPSQESSIELHIRLTPGGLATERWVFASLAVGERVAMQGPLGTFSMIEPEDGPVVLVAGGTGLAPLKAILLHAVEQGLASEIHLYHGGRREEDLYDGDVFQGLAGSGVRYVPVLSEQTWDGACGMVTDAVESDFASCRGMSAYICGPPPMVSAAVRTFKRRRMRPAQIFREEFTPAPLPPGVVGVGAPASS